MPTTKQILEQREYIDCERKKDVMLEIIPLEIKCSQNDSMKCLIFKVNKGEIPAEKRRQLQNQNGENPVEEDAIMLMMTEHGGGAGARHHQNEASPDHQEHEEVTEDGEIHAYGTTPQSVKQQQSLMQ